MEMKKVGTNQFEIFVEGNTFRVCSAERFIGEGSKGFLYEVVNSSDKIAIEQKNFDNSWKVVAFVEWDPIEELPIYSDIAFRILSALKPVDSNSEFYNCIEFAYNMMWDLHEKIV